MILVFSLVSCSEEEKTDDFLNKMEFFVDRYTIRNHQLEEGSRSFYCGEFWDLDSTYTWLTLIPKEWINDELTYRDTIVIDYEVNSQFELIKVLNYQRFYEKIDALKNYFFEKHKLYEVEQANKVYDVFNDSTYLVDKNTQEIDLIGMAYCYLCAYELFEEYGFKESRIGNMIYLSREAEIDNITLQAYLPNMSEFIAEELEILPTENKAFLFVELVINPETNELFQARKTTTIHTDENEVIQNVLEMNIRLKIDD